MSINRSPAPSTKITKRYNSVRSDQSIDTSDTKNTGDTTTVNKTGLSSIDHKSKKQMTVTKCVNAIYDEAIQTFTEEDSIDTSSFTHTVKGDLNSDASRHNFNVGEPGGWNKESVWAGSTSAESDRDYIGQGTKGNGEVKVTETKKRVTLVEKFQDLIEQADKMGIGDSIQNAHGGFVDKGIPNPPQCRKLTYELSKNAMSLLKSNDFNWFKTLDSLNQHAKTHKQDANFCAQLKYDIRQLQTDLMSEMDKAIDGDYDAINEAEMVRVKNEICGKIFEGREAGTVFDTNLYTSHMALAKGLNFNNPETKERWLDQNQENSMIKRAQQYDTVFPDNPKENWDSYVEKQLEGLPTDKKAKLQKQYDRAWSRKETRANNIQNKIKTIKAERTKTQGVEQKYFDQEVELSAMNRLYEEALVTVESKIQDLVEIEAGINALGETVAAEIKNMFSVQLQEAQADVIEAQSNALLYANEPYYAQVTIVNIVAGTQMKMPDSFMENEKNQDVRQEAWQTKLEKDYNVLTIDEGKVIASNENFADLLKGKHEWPYSGHHVKEGSKPADNVNFHLLKASKYAHRALMLLPEPARDGSEKDAFLTKAKNMLKTVDIIYAVRQGDPGTDFKAENGQMFNDSINVMQNSQELQEFAGTYKPLKDMIPIELADTFHSFMESLEAESKKHF